MSAASPSPSKIVCVGRNYAAHAAELGNELPPRPLLFLKPPSALIGDGEAIVLPSASRDVQHEGELGVVIGRRARRVSAREALRYVAAYVALNDVTARDLQREDVQFTRGKGYDTFCPVGAHIAADGIDWSDLEIVCRVNGELRQRGRTRDMVFGVPALIEYISAIMTLEAGDIIATGTPEGVGTLHAGDVVEVEIVGHGKVSNPVESE
jgi:2-keto-4-pentenoate hydratase/2-oxohepta-3-ene-1,7-dioic acid hydratase in catechol pathway